MSNYSLFGLFCFFALIIFPSSITNAFLPPPWHFLLPISASIITICLHNATSLYLESFLRCSQNRDFVPLRNCSLTRPNGCRPRRPHRGRYAREQAYQRMINVRSSCRRSLHYRYVGIMSDPLSDRWRPSIVDIGPRSLYNRYIHS